MNADTILRNLISLSLDINDQDQLSSKTIFNELVNLAISTWGINYLQSEDKYIIFRHGMRWYVSGYQDLYSPMSYCLDFINHNKIGKHFVIFHGCGKYETLTATQQELRYGLKVACRFGPYKQDLLERKKNHAWMHGVAREYINQFQIGKAESYPLALDEFPYLREAHRYMGHCRRQECAIVCNELVCKIEKTMLIERERIYY